MRFIKKFLLKTRLSFSQNRETKDDQISLEAANKIGLLIYINDPADKYSIEKFAQEFIKAGKQVIGLSFSTQASNSVRFSFSCTYFSMEDVGLLGSLDNETVNKFTKTPFDYLYSINILPILPFDLILRKSKARCRVGKLEENADLDLKIQIPSDRGLAFLLDEMKLYSSKINTEKPISA